VVEHLGSGWSAVRILMTLLRGLLPPMAGPGVACTTGVVGSTGQQQQAAGTGWVVVVVVLQAAR
jgi:hypothetical protein